MKTNGTSIVVVPSIVDSVELQAWTGAQREAYATQTLVATRVELLSRLPEWEWDAARFRWRQGVAAAEAYIRQNRSLASVRPHTLSSGFPLGKWVKRCHEEYRAATLPAERAAEVEALPGWSWGRKQVWNDGFTVLQRYVAQTGHARPGHHTTHPRDQVLRNRLR